VTLQPSSKTNFVVVGDNAGPAKLAAIKKHGLKMLNEDQFLDLIATRKSGHVDEKTKKKMAKEQEAIRQAAKEMEKREKEDAKKEDKQDGPSGARCFSIPLVYRLGFLTRTQHKRSQSILPALDNQICPSISQRRLWKQVSGRETPTMAT
jgi:hypothetical protein